MENDKKIMVSICCLTYNHRKYIKKTLDGFLNQKTNFDFEILIHDDCSTDGTTDIIKEYEKKYPKLIKPIYQKENQYSKGIPISVYLQFPRAKGKYIAMCEGDDYWIDNNKLQIQYDMMEKNENCTLCTHTVEYINEAGIKINGSQPHETLLDELPIQNIVYSKDIFNNIFRRTIIPFQTSSYFFRKKYINEYIENFYKNVPVKTVGDIPLTWYLFSKGDCFFIKKSMSRYRVDSIGSWSKKNKKNTNKEKHYSELINFFRMFNDYTNYENNEIIQYLILKYNFYILELKKDYNKIFDKNYKNLFLEFSLRKKILIVLKYIIYKIRNFKIISNKE